MDDPKKKIIDSYKAYTLGFLYQSIREALKGRMTVDLMRDLDGTPGHLVMEIPEVGLKLQIVVQPIPEEPDIGDPARTTM